MVTAVFCKPLPEELAAQALSAKREPRLQNLLVAVNLLPAGVVCKGTARMWSPFLSWCIGTRGCFNGLQYFLPQELPLNPGMVAKIFFPSLILQMWQPSAMVLAAGDPQLIPDVFQVEELLKETGAG